ncbi:MAG: ATP phosphoribosyltransferase, partial [Xanthomonadales bacterium]|nr:ATP phosphoribosyltransferase [Xanthomonadales bacterium]
MNAATQPRLRVAIQKSGRLAEPSQTLLRNCGLHFARSKDKLFWYGTDFPVDLLLVRDDDIPRMLLDGVCELGIVGENIAREVMLERNGGTGLKNLRQLGFGACRLALAVPEDLEISDGMSLQGKRIATSYPALTRALLAEKGIDAHIVELSGSVEIAPRLGTADAISDLVSTGTTLRANHLRELEVLFESQAALFAPETLAPEKQPLQQRLLARLEGVISAAESKYVMLHAPREAVPAITSLLPGVEHPTLLPLEGSDRIAMHAVCVEGIFWEHLEAL